MRVTLALVFFFAITVSVQAQTPGVRIKPDDQILQAGLKDGSEISCLEFGESYLPGGKASGVDDYFIPLEENVAKKKTEYKDFEAFVDNEQVTLQKQLRKNKKKRRRIRRKLKQEKESLTRRQKRRLKKRRKKFQTKIKEIQQEGEDLIQQIETNKQDEKKLESELQQAESTCKRRFTARFSGRDESLSYYKKVITRAEAKHLVRKLTFNDIHLLSDNADEYVLDELINKILSDDSVAADLGDQLSVLRDGLNSPALLPYGGLSILSPSQQLESVAQQTQAFERVRDAYSKGYNGAQRRMRFSSGWSSPLFTMSARFLPSARMKLAHIWMGHFGTSITDFGDDRTEYFIRDYYELIYDNALGNFRTMVLGTSDDACVLEDGVGGGILCDGASNNWLDNEINTFIQPNQNFARELMELYLLGPVDPYTQEPNYTEDDVVAATGFVSGFKNVSYTDSINEFGGPDADTRNATRYRFQFDPTRHDWTPRTAFAGKSYEFSGLATPSDFVEHLFDQHPALPKFIAGKLFRMLAYADPSEELVETFADLFKKSNFDISRLIYAIASSEAMFSEKAMERKCVKSPLEQFLEEARNLQLPHFAVNALDRSDVHNWNTIVNRVKDFDDYVSPAGERALLPPTVFTHSYCGRSPEVVGEDFIAAVKLLYRSKNIISYLNLVGTQNSRIFSFANIEELIRQRLQLGTEILSPDHLINFFEDIYDITLADNERTILMKYLLHDKNDEGVLVETGWNPLEKSFLSKKIIGMISIMHSISITNIK